MDACPTMDGKETEYTAAFDPFEDGGSAVQTKKRRRRVSFAATNTTFFFPRDDETPPLATTAEESNPTGDSFNTENPSKGRRSPWPRIASSASASASSPFLLSYQENEVEKENRRGDNGDSDGDTSGSKGSLTMEEATSSTFHQRSFDNDSEDDSEGFVVDLSHINRDGMDNSISNNDITLDPVTFTLISLNRLVRGDPYTEEKLNNLEDKTMDSDNNKNTSLDIPMSLTCIVPNRKVNFMGKIEGQVSDDSSDMSMVTEFANRKKKPQVDYTSPRKILGEVGNPNIGIDSSSPMKAHGQKIDTGKENWNPSPKPSFGSINDGTDNLMLLCNSETRHSKSLYMKRWLNKDSVVDVTMSVEGMEYTKTNVTNYTELMANVLENNASILEKNATVLENNALKMPKTEIAVLERNTELDPAYLSTSLMSSDGGIKQQPEGSESPSCMHSKNEDMPVDMDMKLYSFLRKDGDDVTIPRLDPSLLVNSTCMHSKNEDTPVDMDMKLYSLLRKDGDDVTIPNLDPSLLVNSTCMHSKNEDTSVDMDMKLYSLLRKDGDDVTIPNFDPKPLVNSTYLEDNDNGAETNNTQLYTGQNLVSTANYDRKWGEKEGSIIAKASIFVDMGENSCESLSSNSDMEVTRPNFEASVSNIGKMRGSHSQPQVASTIAYEDNDFVMDKSELPNMRPMLENCDKNAMSANKKSIPHPSIQSDHEQVQVLKPSLSCSSSSRDCERGNKPTATRQDIYPSSLQKSSRLFNHNGESLLADFIQSMQNEQLSTIQQYMGTKKHTTFSFLSADVQSTQGGCSFLYLVVPQMDLLYERKKEIGDKLNSIQVKNEKLKLHLSNLLHQEPLALQINNRHGDKFKEKLSLAVMLQLKDRLNFQKERLLMFQNGRSYLTDEHEEAKCAKEYLNNLFERIFKVQDIMACATSSGYKFSTKVDANVEDLQSKLEYHRQRLADLKTRRNSRMEKLLSAHKEASTRFNLVKQKLDVLKSKKEDLINSCFDRWNVEGGQTGSKEALESCIAKLSKKLSIQQELQFMELKAARVENGSKHVELCYREIITLRLEFRDDGQVLLTFTTNSNEIEKVFPFMNATRLFEALVKVLECDSTLPLSSVPHAMKRTFCYLGSLVDILSEIEACQSLFQVLTQLSLTDDYDTGVSLQCTFLDNVLGVKVALTFNLSCVMRGEYPSNATPSDIQVHCVQKSIKKELTVVKIERMLRGALPGFGRLKRICGCVYGFLSRMR